MAYDRKVSCFIAIVMSFGLLVAPAGLQAQQKTAAAPATQQTLVQIRTDLFSPSPHFTEDVTALKKILGEDPKSVEAHVLLGLAYRGLGTQEMLAEAVAEFRQALEFDSNFLPARLYLAHIYLELGRPARAKEELETARERAPGDPQLLATLGEAERQLKNPRRAVELTRQALAADSSLMEARYYLGMALADSGQTSDAIKELEQVVKGTGGRPEACFTLGAMYNEAGRFDDAIGVLSEGLKVDPHRPELRIQLARAYRSKGMLDRAEAELVRAQPRPNTTLAASYVQHQQIEFDLYVEQGLVRMKQGQLGAAADSFKKALAMDPNHGQTNNYLAQVYLHQGQFKLASEHAAIATKAGAPLSESDRKQIAEGLAAKTPGGRK